MLRNNCQNRAKFSIKLADLGLFGSLYKYLMISLIFKLYQLIYFYKLAQQNF